MQLRVAAVGGSFERDIAVRQAGAEACSIKVSGAGTLGTVTAPAVSRSNPTARTARG